MPIELTEIDLFEVSLVDAGDDPLAKVTLYKCKDNSDMNEITKTADQWQVEVDTLKEEVETLKAKVSELETEAVEKAKAEEETIDIDGTPVAKSAIPEVVFKHLKAVQKEKEDLEKAAAKASLEKRAVETLPFTKGTPEQKGKLLKAVEDDKELMEILIAGEALFAQMSKELGDKTPQVEKTAKEKIDLMTAKVRESNPKMTYEQAYAEVCKTAEGRSLIAKSYEEDK